MTAPINVQTDETNRKRIERQEASWSAPKLFGLGAVSLGLGLLALAIMSQCQVTPLPFP
ncbi:MAG: hypothetical protein ACOCV4_09465 [Myxococcota bacterium]